VDVTGHFDAHERMRIQLQDYTEHTVPALHIDAYAQEVYQANKDALGVVTPMGPLPQ
jgi:hypothetical protein